MNQTISMPLKIEKLYKYILKIFFAFNRNNSFEF